MDGDMTRKAHFNAEEWAAVAEAPLLAGMRVATAARGGTIRESIAMGRVYTEARRNQGQSELLDDLVSSAPAVDPTGTATPGELERVSAERLREAIRILEEKATPEEVDAYRRFVIDVAEAAARAHREGGFLGIGGEEISEREQAALDEIRRTLGAGAA
jgi:hypothetical protein